MSDSRVIVALDFAKPEQALDFVEGLNPKDCRLKIGKELFTLAGPDLVRRFVNQGYELFLDLKFHDIPATVAKACVAAADLGIWMLNVHASGGRQMMHEAKTALIKHGYSTKLIAVTVLTSMGQNDLDEIGITRSLEDQVSHLALLSQQAGLDGVVCSAQESKLLRNQVDHDFLLVTPGIRPIGSEKDDQKRIVTPEDAIKNGSDYLVVGRPITRAQQPLSVLHAINLDVKKAMAS
ncbi:MAG: orotidine-5'-phosphate decarboxylase [Gammaproteobacteria bacterium]|nr:orotidine-5'-phosphate decarboxylase [Gammaproteobacteria bacterium]